MTLSKPGFAGPAAAAEPVAGPTQGYVGPTSEEEIVSRFGISSGSLIKLDANENPYGASPLATKALSQVEPNRYPDSSGIALRRALGEYTGFPTDNIALGNGSDELIDLLCRVALRPGDHVVICPPTFGVYALAAQAAGAEVVEVPRMRSLCSEHPELATDLPRLLASVDETTRMLFLCSPNNPTGESLSEEDLRLILDLGPLVVLDEAYVEFSGRSHLHLVRDYPNLCVLRTFSKAFGLAGLRVGYGLFPARLAASLASARLPYNVNAAGYAAALGALSDVEWMRRHVSLIMAERERLRAELLLMAGPITTTPLPSETNFLLVRVSGIETYVLHDALLSRGISVRQFRQPDLKDYLRITVGTSEQNSALLDALGRVADE